METRDHKTLFTMRYSDLSLMPDIEPSIPKTLEELRKWTTCSLSRYHTIPMKSLRFNIGRHREAVFFT